MSEVRLIDADALMVSKDWANCTCPAQVIHKAPTIDAVPVVRGEWRFRSNGHNITRIGDYEEWHECSVCKLSADYPSSYCPNCGSYNGGDKA